MKKIKVLFEDAFILVIDKPAGLVVNRAETVKDKTLQDWVEDRHKSIFGKSDSLSSFIKRSGIVHRLDKDTSGAMVIAKDITAFNHLQSQFKKRQVKKHYLALVHGRLEPKLGDIKMPLARQPSDRKKITVRLGGRVAVTQYQRLGLYNGYSLVELEPETGRTHQIRVHLKHINHPIVADPIYLGDKRLKQDLGFCPRLFLHALKLSFVHPNTKKRVSFESKLALDLKRALASLKSI